MPGGDESTARKDDFHSSKIVLSDLEASEHCMEAASRTERLFGISKESFTRGQFNGMHCSEAMKAILDQSRRRKSDFQSSKAILTDLDGGEDSMDKAIALAMRTASL